jgi:hypothetical protein
MTEQATKKAKASKAGKVLTVKERDKAEREAKAEVERDVKAEREAEAKAKAEREAERNPPLQIIELTYAEQFYRQYLISGKQNRHGFATIGKVHLAFKADYLTFKGKKAPNAEVKAFREKHFPKLDAQTASYCQALYEEFTLIDAWAQENAPMLHNPRHLVQAYRKATQKPKAKTEAKGTDSHQELEKAERALMETLYKRFVTDGEKLYTYFKANKERDKTRIVRIKTICADIAKVAEATLTK